MTTEITKQKQWEKLLGYILGNQAAWIANIGIRSGLFSEIAKAGKKGILEEEMARQLNYKLRYIQVWCRAAYAFELLDWNANSGYNLAPYMKELLLDNSDLQFMGGRFQFYTALYEDYKAFPEYLKTGDIWPRSEHDPFILEAIKNLTKGDGALITEHILPQIPNTLDNLKAGGIILDIGAGGGYHSTHYVRCFPNTKVIALEIDELSIVLAQKTVDSAKLAKQIEIRHADVTLLNDEGVYDLITMSLALHETGGPAEYQDVINRAYKALKPGGAVIVSEIPYPDQPGEYREHMIYKLLAGVQLHEALVGCGMITQGELPRLLKGGNFVNIKVATQPNPARFIMIGEKRV